VINGFRQFSRLLKISAILSRYRLDEFLEATHLYRPIAATSPMPRAAKDCAWR